MDKDRIAGSVKDFAGRVEDRSAMRPAMRKPGPPAGCARPLGPCKISTARPRMPRATSAMPRRDAYENSGDTLRDGSQAVARKVQDNPLGSLLVAGGIGFALALLMTR